MFLVNPKSYGNHMWIFLNVLICMLKSKFSNLEGFSQVWYCFFESSERYTCTELTLRQSRQGYISCGIQCFRLKKYLNENGSLPVQQVTKVEGRNCYQPKYEIVHLSSDSAELCTVSRNEQTNHSVTNLLHIYFSRSFTNMQVNI